MSKKLNYESDSFLSFKLGDELFSANVAKVLNILEWVKITKVPKSPEYMKGVINLRGNVLPVIDMKLKFGMEVTQQTSDTCILVLDIDIDNESIQVGAIVDSVQEVLELTEDKILPPPSIGSKYKSEFIYGVAKSADEFIMLLDMDKVFSIDELISLKETSANTKKKSVVEAVEAN
ncbi:MAG: chemotaxis protein CheW [Bacteroidales bacterium]|nr:chemotaxis protein CheW [Bacteroidales bacterium]